MVYRTYGNVYGSLIPGAYLRQRPVSQLGTMCHECCHTYQARYSAALFSYTTLLVRTAFTSCWTRVRMTNQ